jgi:hypothetical protein
VFSGNSDLPPSKKHCGERNNYCCISAKPSPGIAQNVHLLVSFWRTLGRRICTHRAANIDPRGSGAIVGAIVGFQSKVIADNRTTY